MEQEALQGFLDASVPPLPGSSVRRVPGAYELLDRMAPAAHRRHGARPFRREVTAQVAPNRKVVELIGERDVGCRPPFTATARQSILDCGWTNNPQSVRGLTLFRRA